MCLPVVFYISNKDFLRAAHDSLGVFVKQLEEFSLVASYMTIMCGTQELGTICDKGKKKRRKVQENNY